VLLPPARATPEALAAAIRSFTGDAPLREGKVQLDVAPLVDNGNTVPVTVSVPGAPAADVRRWRCSTSATRRATCCVSTSGRAPARARVSTRIRLATSQQLVAVARLADGSCWRSGGRGGGDAGRVHRVAGMART
jgi:sulfur-oxidizing protein SoxY